MSIGAVAFAYCKGLTSITIEGEKSIEKAAFRGCDNVKIVNSLNAVPCKCAEDAFKDIAGKAKLYVPIGSYDAYRKATGWKEFKEVEETDFSSGVEGISRKCRGLPDGKYLIDGRISILKDGKTYDTSGVKR